MSKRLAKQSNAGFSLIELLIAMTLTLTVMSIATVLLAQALNVRTRTNSNNDALADAQRALNIMSREISSAGFNLSGNGIVSGDTTTDVNGNSMIRVRSNLNKFDETASTTARNEIGVAGEDAGEDIKYFVHKADNTNLLARYDEYAEAGGSVTVLANRLDSLYIHYYAGKVSYGTSGCDVTGASGAEVSPSAAQYLVVAVCVQLGAIGTPGSAGYQPQHSVLLVSDVTLRNSNLPSY
ncbi:MAG TPA: prepilin-type N-terminal cleavage/methylation domain-containing protein [Pyrinomonadaceae bacterium]|jgi:type II secretory pathway pseudopilin PulG|nr:prepilin-type N-terminal cleavage/methylation domain-containing protein [Pyrinomonadaceae bacterium]